MVFLRLTSYHIHWTWLSLNLLRLILKSNSFLRGKDSSYREYCKTYALKSILRKEFQKCLSKDRIFSMTTVKKMAFIWISN